MSYDEAVIGRVVCVSGSQIVTTLEHAGRPGEDAFRVQKGAIVKIRLPNSCVFCTVSGLSIPVPSRGEAQPAVHLAELELFGELAPGFEDEPGSFRRGVSGYPALGDPVYVASGSDLARILQRPVRSAIQIGTMQQDAAQAVFITPDDLLGKHFAVLGTTGSGKSCVVTLLLRGILEQHPNAHIVLLDPHNEYSRAFGERAELLGPESLRLPYWLLNSEEITKIITGPAESRQISEAVASLITELIPIAKQAYRRDTSGGANLTVNTPVPYRLSDLDRLLDDAMGRLDRPESLAPYRWLKARLATLTRDTRYAFMFGGISVNDNMAAIISRMFRIPVNGRPITILDLSAVPSEILNVVASVLLRMAFDFALWSRGAQPLLLVCEEAHRYAPADARLGFEPTKEVLARIAKEGRKYGLALCMVSQRPSELDLAILSQCNSVFAFRMTSLKDQEFVRGIVTDNAYGLLDFLPSLGDAEAIVAGQAVPVPMRVRLARLPPEALPRSATASFSESWRNPSLDDAFVAEVVQKWRMQVR